ncbi:Putative ribonuclease H protein [Dendrobium catenatum]|uniref:Ribonuclease H protein n=1 Tax=Dendrobium catenatum TaxID=906689 RepID=A0A2I0XEP8_9ASPA|nr:Putative ribonuclease H protein [Dendrobium catenatum]
MKLGLTIFLTLLTLWVISHFHELFNPVVSITQDSVPLPVGRSIPNADFLSLTLPISETEIKNAVFSGDSSSSAGPDGFNFHFYKTGWHIIGPSLCKAIQSFFIKGYIPSGIKATALFLIPKTSHVNTISDFRPISLCNTLYKIISKILANRLKCFMPHIIDMAQAGFIKHRISTDNVILASELLRFFKKCTKVPYMCAKLDIKKAFDSLSRDFLFQRMAQKGIPPIFIKWVKACITGVNFSIFMDGQLEGYIPSSVGLRQGCPLSPYLFCIAMDALSSLLDNVNGDFTFQPVNIKGFKISHLLYADDVLVFGQANVRNCNILNSILQRFALSSGLKVNPAKSTIILQDNYPFGKDICDILNIHNVGNSLSYLGIPISINRTRLSHFSPLLDVISNRLSGWKAKSLSFPGRLQFLKFTIWNTIAYWIRGAIIPKSICKQMAKLSAKFLYFGNIDSRKLHMVSWANTCKPKEKGGLGIPNFHAIRYAFDCSLILRLYQTRSPLSDWFFMIHCSSWKPHSPSSSAMWKSICLTATKAKPNFFFKVTDNSPISLLWDHWYNGLHIQDIPDFESYTSICSVNARLDSLIANGNWNFPSICSDNFKNVVSPIPIVCGDRRHCISWGANDRQKFHCFMMDFYKTEAEVNWYKAVWHKHSALRFSIYAWLCFVGGLKTTDALQKRNIYVNPMCVFCQCNAESVSHLFFECDYTFSIITSLIPAISSFLLRPNLFQISDYLINCGDSTSGTSEVKFLTLWAAVYYLWRERNERKFVHHFKSQTTVQLLIKKAVDLKLKRWKNY